MRAIYYKESFIKLSKFIDRKNIEIAQANEHRAAKIQPLRAEHFELMKELIKCFAKQINKGKRADKLMMNNKALATLRKVSPRTIRRNLDRLETHQLITKDESLKKDKRGRKSRPRLQNFGIEINAALLFYSDQVDRSEIEAAQKKIEFDSYLQHAKKKYIPIENTSICPLTEVENLKKINKGKKECLKLDRKDQGKSIGNTKSRSKEEKAVNSVAFEQSVCFSSFALILRFAMQLYIFAYSRFWSSYDYFAASQIKTTVEYFIEQFVNVDKSEYRAIFEQQKQILLTANRWIEQDKTRYIPLPHVFFDPRNETGIEMYKTRYKKARTSRKQLELESQNFKENNLMFRIFQKNADLYLKDKSMSHYNKILRTFEKSQYSELYANSFNESILTLNQ